MKVPLKSAIRNPQSVVRNQLFPVSPLNSLPLVAPHPIGKEEYDEPQQTECDSNGGPGE
ncbi:MAG: hypothetical protein L0226_11825 [Acidobacteria bacterium]|nr:hypothetical protein [Acidobacteriota bacterium]